MAGMLPGVEAARRRRFHKNYGSETSSARRPSLSLYATTHDFLQNSSLQQRNPISNKELYDESRLDTAAREAKKRLDERLQSQTKSEEKPKTKGNGAKRLSWLKLRWRLTEEEECAVCLEALKRRGGGGALMQLPCGHRFHTDCLLPWLEGNSHCPCCRMAINLLL